MQSVRFQRSSHASLRPERAAALFGLAALFVLFAVSARAQQGGGSFTLEADQTRVAVGDPITVTLEMANLTRAQANPSRPDFGDLTMEGGPVPLYSTNVINGQVTISQSWRWQVSAPKPGTYTIGPSEVEVGGKTYRTESITIVATKQATTALPPSLQGQGIISARSRNTSVNKQLDGHLFLRPTVSTTTPYVGQPVMVSYTLYKDPRLSLTNLSEQPRDIQGALSEELYHLKSINWQREQIDGQSFDACLMLRQAIIPTKPGSLTVDGYQLVGAVLLPNRRGGMSNPSDDPFEQMQQMMGGDPFSFDPFGMSGVNVQIASPPVELKVRPLPEAGQPAGYTGVVGDYSITASVDRTKVSLDDLITLSLLVDGRGAVETAAPPTLPTGDYDVVGSESHVNKRDEKTTIGGSKLFQFVLRPRHAGPLTIPAVSYAMFNPWDEQYHTAKTEPVSLLISPGAGGATTTEPSAAGGGDASAAGAPAGAGTAGDQLDYLKPLDSLRTGHPTPLLTDPLAWGALLSALALCVLAWWRRRAELRRDPAQARRQGAWRQFERRIRAIQQQAAGEEPAETAGALEQAVRDCIADTFNLHADGLTRADIERLLRERAMPYERVERICDLLDQCATLRYAPGGAGRVEISAWTEELSHLLKEGLA